ncbi:MAG TPA: tetratricopeptide repeat protein, partial [Candidatus Omnitrophota bacterium]|nr:tetratricopeptide repeat protein [Candidatus Omnitrophota bacterium]
IFVVHPAEDAEERPEGHRAVDFYRRKGFYPIHFSWFEGLDEEEQERNLYMSLCYDSAERVVRQAALNLSACETASGEQLRLFIEPPEDRDEGPDVSSPVERASNGQRKYPYYLFNGMGEGRAVYGMLEAKVVPVILDRFVKGEMGSKIRVLSFGGIRRWGGRPMLAEAHRIAIAFMEEARARGITLTPEDLEISVVNDDADALRKAQEGLYDLDAFRSLNTPRRVTKASLNLVRKYFFRVKGSTFQLRDDIRQMVRIVPVENYLNYKPAGGAFDLILYNYYEYLIEAKQEAAKPIQTAIIANNMLNWMNEGALLLTTAGKWFRFFLDMKRIARGTTPFREQGITSVNIYVYQYFHVDYSQAWFEDMYLRIKANLSRNGIPFNERFLDAVFAHAYLIHYGIKRERGEPYFTHPLRVALAMSRNFKLFNYLLKKGIPADVVLAAAFLHDMIEEYAEAGRDVVRLLIDVRNRLLPLSDRPTVRLVARIVLILTHRANEDDPEFLARILSRSSPPYFVAQLIKIYDRLDNVRPPRFSKSEENILEYVRQTTDFVAWADAVPDFVKREFASIIRELYTKELLKEAKPLFNDNKGHPEISLLMSRETQDATTPSDHDVREAEALIRQYRTQAFVLPASLEKIIEEQNAVVAERIKEFAFPYEWSDEERIRIITDVFVAYNTEYFRGQETYGARTDRMHPVNVVNLLGTVLGRQPNFVEYVSGLLHDSDRVALNPVPKISGAYDELVRKQYVHPLHSARFAREILTRLNIATSREIRDIVWIIIRHDMELNKGVSFAGQTLVRPVLAHHRLRASVEAVVNADKLSFFDSTIGLFVHDRRDRLDHVIARVASNLMQLTPDWRREAVALAANNFKDDVLVQDVLRQALNRLEDDPVSSPIKTTEERLPGYLNPEGLIQLGARVAETPVKDYSAMKYEYQITYENESGETVKGQIVVRDLTAAETINRQPYTLELKLLFPNLPRGNNFGKTLLWSVLTRRQDWQGRTCAILSAQPDAIRILRKMPDLTPRFIRLNEDGYFSDNVLITVPVLNQEQNKAVEDFMGRVMSAESASSPLERTGLKERREESTAALMESIGQGDIQGLYRLIGEFIGVKGAVVDVGCSSNWLPLRGMLAAGAERAYGVDVFERWADVENVEMRVSDAAQGLPFAPESVEAVIFHRSLVHIIKSRRGEDVYDIVDAVMQHAVRVVKPDGWICLFHDSVVDGGNIPEAAALASFVDASRYKQIDVKSGNKHLIMIQKLQKGMPNRDKDTEEPLTSSPISAAAVSAWIFKKMKNQLVSRELAGKPQRSAEFKVNGIRGSPRKRWVFASLVALVMLLPHMAISQQLKSITEPPPFGSVYASVQQVEIATLLKSRGYPESQIPGLIRLFEDLLEEINFNSFKKELQSKDSQKLTLALTRLISAVDEKGYLNTQQPKPLVKLLVNALNPKNEDIFKILEESPIPPEAKQSQKHHLVSCTTLSQLADILLKIAGVETRAGYSISVIRNEGHIFLLVPVNTTRFIWVDFINRTIREMDFFNYYRQEGRYLILNPDQRLNLSHLRDLIPALPDIDVLSDKEWLNFIANYALLARTPDGTLITAGMVDNLGSAYVSVLGQPETAVKAFQSAIQLNPDFAEAYYNLGNAYGDLGRHAEAIQVYQSAITLNPNFAEAYNNLGLAYAACGQYVEAIKAYQSALNLDHY